MYIVHIEFHGMQAYLTAVPRLRSIVGANALLGETLRNELVLEVKKHNAYPLDEIIENHGAVFPKKSNIDPLNRIETGVSSEMPKEVDKDNPVELFRQGILVRDGGHFVAVFEKEDQADTFCKSANRIIQERLPGVTLEFKSSVLTATEKVNDGKEKRSEVKSDIVDIVDIPFFQVCKESGNGPAVQYNKVKNTYLSQSAELTRQKGEQFFEKNTRDIIGLLSKQLPLQHKAPPEDFHQLCSNDYMAVIHADGNSMGKRFQQWQENGKKEVTVTDPLNKDLLQEAHNEKFFYSMRVVVRTSIIEALNETFKEFKGYYRPYQLLMLGGDDLLLVCQAKYAMDFIKNYAKALESKNLIDGNPLTIGAGIVISKPNLPFHRLLEIAEGLASSAKQLYKDSVRNDRQEGRSVVDWLITTNSWVEDPDEVHKQESWVRYKVGDTYEELVLTNRPCFILGDDNSLESMLEKANELKKSLERKQELNPTEENKRPARSKFRALVQSMRKGKRYSDLAFLELPESTRKALGNALSIDYQNDDVTIWKPCSGKDSEKWKTRLADIIELYEIANLGSREA